MDASEVRAIVGSFPETTEQPHGGREAFRTRGRVLVVIESDEADVVLNVSPDERRSLTEEDPTSYREIEDRRGKVVEEWITVHLATADGTQVRELLEDAWRRHATKRAIRRWEQTQQG